MAKLLGKEYVNYTGRDGKQKEQYNLYFLTGVNVDEGVACGIASAPSSRPAFLQAKELKVNDEFVMTLDRYNRATELVITKTA